LKTIIALKYLGTCNGKGIARYEFHHSNNDIINNAKRHWDYAIQDGIDGCVLVRMSNGEPEREIEIENEKVKYIIEYPKGSTQTDINIREWLIEKLVADYEIKQNI